MVEREKRLIENHFQHIPPLVVEQDPVASPLGLHVFLFPTLIAFQYNSSFPLYYLSFFSVLLYFAGILLQFAVALLKSSRASRENMLIYFLTCFSTQVELVVLHEKLSAVDWYHHHSIIKILTLYIYIERNVFLSSLWTFLSQKLCYLLLCAFYILDVKQFVTSVCSTFMRFWCGKRKYWKSGNELSISWKPRGAI